MTMSNYYEDYDFDPTEEDLENMEREYARMFPEEKPLTKWEKFKKFFSFAKIRSKKAAKEVDKDIKKQEDLLDMVDWNKQIEYKPEFSQEDNNVYYYQAPRPAPEPVSVEPEQEALKNISQSLATVFHSVAETIDVVQTRKEK